MTKKPLKCWRAAKPWACSRWKARACAARKLGLEQIEYVHPALEPILAPTYGIITYQEQVQQIARDLAGFSLAEADLLRRAMGKKIKSEMAAQRGRFLAGAIERGVDEAVAITIFDACAKFAEYG